MIYILYSADYELFLGRNYLPETDVLIKPTEALLTTCDKLGIPMTLFADVACVWRYRDYGISAFAKEVEAQLRRAIQGGHDVQLHIHPHWLRASLEEGQWHFKAEEFLLGRFYSDERECREFACRLFTRGKSYLEELLRPVRADYKCIAFRAGGYGIQPQETAILEALTDSEFLIDSSIVPGLVLKNGINEVDFHNFKPSPGFWLSKGRGFTQSSRKDGHIYEIPVAAFQESHWDAFLRLAAKGLRGRSSKKISRPSSPRGNSIQQYSQSPRQGQPPAPERQSKISALLSRIQPQHFELELTSRTNEMLNTTIRYLAKAKKNSADKDIFFSFSCHPKGIFEEDLESLSIYHQRLKQIFEDEIMAISFRDAATLLCNQPTK